jgi:hypothetical protein
MYFFQHAAVLGSSNLMVKVTPALVVDYELGDWWTTENQCYSEQNVSFSCSKDLEHEHHRMDAEYSMAVNVGSPTNVRVQFWGSCN